jgi:hypothetical protein
MIRILFVTASLVAVSAATAHDWNHPELDGWYSSLKRPNARNSLRGFTSCCSQIDCHTTDAELRQSTWWARIGIRQSNGDWDLRDWVQVPAEVVLSNHDNPTGEGVICHSTTWASDGRTLDPHGVSIWCFVPPSES